jgi:hypothetical protein
LSFLILVAARNAPVDAVFGRFRHIRRDDALALIAQPATS